MKTLNKELVINIGFFTVLGALNGAVMSLVACFMMDYMVASYTINYTMSYSDWVLVLAPMFAVIGALFNLAAAIFMYEEPEKKGLFDFLKRDKNKNKK